jgi:hypothetical protein
VGLVVCLPPEGGISIRLNGKNSVTHPRGRLQIAYRRTNEIGEK